MQIKGVPVSDAAVRPEMHFVRKCTAEGCRPVYDAAIHMAGPEGCLGTSASCYANSRITDMRRVIAGVSLVVMTACPFTAGAADSSSLGPVEAMSIAVDAYVYGYPLVTFDTVRKQQTNVTKPDAEHAPMGQMIKMRSYPAVDNHCCAAPNADTLYTEAWLDVSKEPVVFSIPEMGSRYYMMPILSGWSEVIFVAGSGTTGGKPQTVLITGPGWKG